VNQLLLGSGSWHWPGWVTVDANPENQPDILAVLPPLPAEVTGVMWDRILASHFIEHLHRWDALTLLKQCYACLKPDGVLTLEQPNIDYCMKVAVGMIAVPEGRDWEQFSLWGIYGAPNGNPWDGHKWGYTPASLTQLLTEVGFDSRKLVIRPGQYHEPQRDFIVEATR
jgi:predicted SAM-dependent methyltransferase